jgi:hypothetical protein
VQMNLQIQFNACSIANTVIKFKMFTKFNK